MPDRNRNSSKTETFKVKLFRCAVQVETGNRTVSEVHPRTGREGPEGEFKYSCTLSLALALGWGGWSTQPPGSSTLENGT